MPIVRRHPKHSLFACMLLGGEAFFYQSGRCTLVHSGDLIIYSTEKPYLYGFTQRMRQLMIDIKTDEVFDSGDEISQTSLLNVSSLNTLRTASSMPKPSQATWPCRCAI